MAATPKLDRILPAVDFDNTKLEQALTDLMHQADVNLVVLWPAINGVGVDQDVPVTIHLKNVSPAAALDAMLSLGDPKHHCVWNESSGVVTVTAADSMDKSQLVVRIYDVKQLRTARFHLGQIQELSLQISENQGGVQAPAQGLPPTAQQATEWAEAMQLNQIKKLITDNVRPESWKDNGGDLGSISSFGDLLIMTQTEQAQRNIEAFLQLVDHQ